MKLFLKKSAGDVYGPVSSAELSAWAAEGRIAPEDTLSPDQSEWRPASAYPELGMEWIATLPDGNTYGPIHLHALVELVQEGLVDPRSTIQHTRANEQHVLSEALLSVLIENNEGLRNSIVTLHGHLAEAREREATAAAAAETALESAAAHKELVDKVDALRGEIKTAKATATEWESKCEQAESAAAEERQEHEQAVRALETRLGESAATIETLKQDLEAARAAVEKQGADEGEAHDLRRQVETLKAERDRLREQLEASTDASTQAPTEYKELAVANDGLKKDVAKWRGMYDAERENAVKREAALKDRIDELRRSEASAVVDRDELSRRLRHVQESYEMIGKAAEQAEDKDSVSAVQLSVLVASHSELSQRYDGLFAQLQEKTDSLNRLLSERKEAETRSWERLKDMETSLQREQEEADEARRQLADMQQSHFQLLKSYREMNDRFIHFRQVAGQPEAAAPPPGEGPGVPAPEKPPAKGPRIRLNR